MTILSFIKSLVHQEKRTDTSNSYGVPTFDPVTPQEAERIYLDFLSKQELKKAKKDANSTLSLHVQTINEKLESLVAPVMDKCNQWIQSLYIQEGSTVVETFNTMLMNNIVVVLIMFACIVCIKAESRYIEWFFFLLVLVACVIGYQMIWKKPLRPYVNWSVGSIGVICILLPLLISLVCLARPSMLQPRTGKIERELDELKEQRDTIKKLNIQDSRNAIAKYMSVEYRNTSYPFTNGETTTNGNWDNCIIEHAREIPDDFCFVQQVLEKNGTSDILVKIGLDVQLLVDLREKGYFTDVTVYQAFREGMFRVNDSNSILGSVAYLSAVFIPTTAMVCATFKYVQTPRGDKIGNTWQSWMVGQFCMFIVWCLTSLISTSNGQLETSASVWEFCSLMSSVVVCAALVHYGIYLIKRYRRDFAFMIVGIVLMIIAMILTYYYAKSQILAFFCWANPFKSKSEC